MYNPYRLIVTVTTHNEVKYWKNVLAQHNKIKVVKKGNKTEIWAKYKTTTYFK